MICLRRFRIPERHMVAFWTWVIKNQIGDISGIRSAEDSLANWRNHTISGRLRDRLVIIDSMSFPDEELAIYCLLRFVSGWGGMTPQN
jgi:hypothetical protein